MNNEGANNGIFSLLGKQLDTFTDKLRQINRKTEAKMNAENRINSTTTFPALNAIAAILKAVAIFSLLLSVVTLILFFLTLPFVEYDWLILASLGLFISGFPMLSFAELILLLLQIEINTRNSNIISVPQREYFTNTNSMDNTSNNADVVKCVNCGHIYASDAKGQYCENCGGLIN